MELAAVEHALMFVLPSHRPLHIYTDSKYVVNCINRWVMTWRRTNWINSQGKPVKNKNMIDRIRLLLDMHRDHNRNNTQLQWTRGHAGNRFNELADALAGIARIDQATDWQPEQDHRAIL